MIETTLPWYAYHPIGRQATLAVNTHVGRSLVEVHCNAPYRKGTCGKLLGGAWKTNFGTVVSILEFDHNSDREWYQRHYKSAATRQALWREGGFVMERPMLLRTDGTWHEVPGESDPQIVRCPRHGRWRLDIEEIKHAVDAALRSGKHARYQTIPPTP